jgi:hypothetical protein
LLPELVDTELRSTGVLHAKVIVQLVATLGNEAPQLKVVVSLVQVPLPEEEVVVEL